MFYQVAVDAQVNRLHTYRHSEHLQRGTRVLVPFGTRQNYGVVLEALSTQKFPYRVKDIDKVLEQQPYYSPTLLQLAQFISTYYFCPLGRVLALIAPRYLTVSDTQKTAVEDTPPLRVNDDAPILTAAQQQALQAIQQHGNSKPVLLHGITDAGKTEVYLHLIAALLNAATTAPRPQFLVMVPEIALTAQMVRVFTQRFPQQVVVAHSALTVAQRWQNYRLLRAGKRAVLIGARSSVFAPFAHLKLIIVDEEHDSSYKQSSQVAYHGRDIAIYRAQLEDTQIVLGSATPALESWHNAKQGKYHLVELSQRIHGNHPQQVQLLATACPTTHTDLSVAQQAEEVISEETAARISATLAARKQVIVIINRRGFSHYLLAKTTGNVITCANCSVSLTLHDNFSLLKCHYCDYRLPLAKLREGRQSEDFHICGYGSERIETALQKKFPAASIARLDSDTTARKGELERVLQRFRHHEIDLLVGTQMLAKGHDFPDVALLVILHADQMLLMPDFRAAERTFQLLVQAMGRAGRSDNPSAVLVEVSRATSPVLTTALAQDYLAFVRDELAFREQFRYPPFTRFACLELNSPQRKQLQAITLKISQLLARSGDLHIRGPADPPLAKINQRYRKVIYFCARDARQLHALLRFWQPRLQPLIPSQVRTFIDVDPHTTL